MKLYEIDFFFAFFSEDSKKYIFFISKKNVLSINTERVISVSADATKRRLSITLMIFSRHVAHTSNMKISYNLSFFFVYGHKFKVSNMHMNHF